MAVSQIESDIIRIVRQTYPDAADVEITPEMSFADLGLDSLTRIDVLAAAEAHFGIEVPDDVVGTLMTVQDLGIFVEKAAIG
jgi:acyl carrier protein